MRRVERHKWIHWGGSLDGIHLQMWRQGEKQDDPWWWGIGAGSCQGTHAGEESWKIERTQENQLLEWRYCQYGCEWGER